jgi:isoleucyl-tRNA synthetase
VRLLAPITSFTAEEVWQVLTGDAEQSVMFHTWHELPTPEGEGQLLAKWALIRVVRADVTKALEAQREAGKIGSALQAAVAIRCDGEKYEALASLGDDLKFVLICSSTAVIKDDNERVVAMQLDHAKCERCWHVRDDVGGAAEHPTLCGRCISNLHGGGEVRAFA